MWNRFSNLPESSPLVGAAVRSVCSGLALTSLSACAGLQASNAEKDFLCDAQVGTPCVTMAEADGGHGAGSVTPVAEALVDQQNGALSPTPLKARKIGVAGNAAFGGMADGGAPYWASNYRIPEKLGTIWIAPHLDADGLLHEATFVHFVIEDARWGNRSR